LIIHLPDPDATAALGAALAPLLREGDVVALSGTLGMGKTALAQGLLAALGETGEVSSPTFTLVHIYTPPHAPCPIWHCDLYRLESPDDMLELGLDEAFDSAITVIEWPERAGALLPRGALRIRLEPDSDGRMATLDGGTAWQARLEALQPSA
jgi:tRNA threonylcarbamoyladenosine biosynthesis protein TsaE